MPRILQSYTLWIAIFLSLPTLVILATWNLLPGQPFYSVKRGIEDVPRLALGQTKVAADYEVALADRRFSEASTLVRSNNSLGLTELKTSLKTAEQKVVDTQNYQAKEKLLTNLVSYNQQLEVQKQTIIMVYYVQNPLPTVGKQQSPSSTTTQAPPTAAATTSATQSVPVSNQPVVISPVQTVNSITDTQKEINQVISELQQHSQGQQFNFPSRGLIKQDGSASGNRRPSNFQLPQKRN